MKFIHIESAPWWYDLAWSSNPNSFLLRVETGALNLVLADAERFKTFEQANPKVRIGGKGVFFERSGKRDPDFATFRLRLSKMRRNREYDWDLGRRTTWLLQEMLRTLSFVEGQPRVSEPQLVTAEVYDANRSMHGFPLSGRLGREFKEWAKGQGRIVQDAAQRAMHQAWVEMVGREDPKYFRCWTEGDGAFHMDVPGNCACVGVDGSRRDDDWGFEFFSHNVDAPWQQLSLLAGIATLWQSARKEVKEKALGAA